MRKQKNITSASSQIVRENLSLTNSLNYWYSVYKKSSSQSSKIYVLTSQLRFPRT